MICVPRNRDTSSTKGPIQKTSLDTEYSDWELDIFSHQ